MSEYRITKIEKCKYCAGVSYPSDCVCAECKGSGKVRTEVELEVALKELGYAKSADIVWGGFDLK